MICFRAGYNKNSPTIYVKYNGYKSKIIQHEFFGPDPVHVYAIKLGPIVKNIVKTP